MSKPDQFKYLTQEQRDHLRCIVAEMARRRHRSRRWPMARCWIEIALQTGLRISECAALRIGDFDYERQSIVVTNGKHSNGKWNTVPLPLNLQDTVQRYIDLKRKRNEPVGPDAPLFLSNTGIQADSSVLRRLWDHVCNAANLDRSKYSPHCLRHTALLWAYERCRDIYAVQRLARHSDLGSTQIYVTWTNELDADLNNVLESLYA